MRPQYQEGDVGRIPWPDLSPLTCENLATIADKILLIVRSYAAFDETDHAFAGQITGGVKVDEYADTISQLERDANEQFSKELGLESQDLEFIAKEIQSAYFDSARIFRFEKTCHDILPFSLGCCVGRWDIRISRDKTFVPKYGDPFGALPRCSLAMLVGPDGLPAKPDGIVCEKWLRARPDANTLPPLGAAAQPTIKVEEYPLRISWDGILVDDPGLEGTQPYQDDIVRRAREVLDPVWGDRAEAIEQEVCEILGVRDLREYFRRPAGFFDDHLKRYSKSKRKAPIYWPLSTASGSYTVWVYYQRLTDQTLYTMVNRYVEPKIAEVERANAGIEGDMKIASGRQATQLRDRWQEVRAFLAELHDSRQELLRVAALPYKPDLNDGVIINAAPLHRLFRHRQWAKDT